MFDIGWSELVVIGVVALIAIGPKELPGVLRTVGQYMGKIRRMASEFQGQFQEAMREAEMADLKKQVDEMTDTGEGLHQLRSDRHRCARRSTASPPIRSARIRRRRDAVAATARRPRPRRRARPRRCRLTPPFRSRLADAAIAPEAPQPQDRERHDRKPGAAREHRGRREGDRGQQGAADVAPDRAALAADQGAGGVLHRRGRSASSSPSRSTTSWSGPTSGSRARRTRSSSTPRCSNTSSPS